MDASIVNVLGDEFAAGTVTLETTPREFIKKFAKEHPEEASSIFGGQQELEKAINSDFAIDVTKSSVSLVSGNEYLPLNWDANLLNQGDKVKELVKNAKNLVFNVSVSMPNA